MMLVLLGGFCLTMVLGGYLVELIFGTAGPVPPHGQAKIMEEGVTWNYTTWLNILAFALTAVLLVRFFRTGGREMMSMMNGEPDDMAQHVHGDHGHSAQDVSHQPYVADDPDRHAGHHGRRR